MNGYKDIKTHPFFEDLEWELLETRELDVPALDVFLSKCD